jgi:Mg2+/citrate symporter
MKRILFFGMLILSAGIVAGCFSPAGMVAPIASNPPAISADSPGTSCVSVSAAISFEEGDIVTSSPEAEALFYRGMECLSRHGSENESIAYFDAALSIDQNFTAARQARCVALINLQHSDTGISC